MSTFSVLFLIDGMDDAASTGYSAWPERLYVISDGGVVIYNGGKGAYGFSPDELEEFLAEHIEGNGVMQ